MLNGQQTVVEEGALSNTTMLQAYQDFLNTTAMVLSRHTITLDFGVIIKVMALL